MATVYPVKARRTGTDATALGEFEPTDTLPDSVVAASNVTQHFPGGFPPAAHTHSAADIVSGNLAYARLPVGTGTWDLGNPADILTFLRGFRVNGLLQAGSEFHIASANAIRWKDGVTGTERATQRVFGTDWAIEVGGLEGFRVLAAAAGFVIPATSRMHIDGAAGVPGDTYIQEYLPNLMAFFAGGNLSFMVKQDGIGVSSGFRFYMDGLVDSYFYEPSDDEIRFVAGGVAAIQLDDDVTAGNSRLFIGIAGLGLTRVKYGNAGTGPGGGTQRALYIDYGA